MAPGCFTTSSQEKKQEQPEHDIESLKLAPPNQIPLPLTPPPDTILETETEATTRRIDSFEVLEQTIIKQKRLARLKNTDLRKKILLKRTFDLVCEIMDHENGFEDDEPAKDEDMKPELITTDERSNEFDDEEDEEEETLTNTQENVANTTTLFKFDEEMKSDSDDPDSIYLNILSESDLIQFRFEEEKCVQAEVPLRSSSCKRRRLSNSDSDSDDDDDDFSDFILRDQELSSFSTCLNKLSPVDLNLYNDYTLKRPTTGDSTRLENLNKKIKF